MFICIMSLLSYCPLWDIICWVYEQDFMFPMLKASTSCLTKRGFHKWILTCYILELQRELLRAECLLLENREWWLLWLIPRSWRARCTQSHMTWLILDGSWLLLSSWLLAVKEERFSVEVCACHACTCLEVFSCTIAHKVKLSRDIGGGLWECLVMR